MGKSGVFLQKLITNIIIYGFAVFVVSIIAYTFITAKGVIPLNRIYEKNQQINIILPQTHDRINIKYRRAVEGKNYMKLLYTFASLKNDYDSYNINANLVITNSGSLSRFDKSPFMIFPLVTIAKDKYGNLIRSGFTILKNSLFFFNKTMMRKENNINIFSEGGKKICANLYLNTFKLYMQNHKILSYGKVVYSKKSLYARNVFIGAHAGYMRYNGTAKTLKLLLTNKKQSIGKLKGLNMSSHDSKIKGNVCYFQQYGENTDIYILNGFYFAYNNLNIETLHPVFLSINQQYTEVLFYLDNVIRGRNIIIVGYNMKVKRMDGKTIISSSVPLRIELEKGILFARKIILYAEKGKYKLAGNINGILYGAGKDIELSGENLNIKETTKTLKLYSHNPVIFKTKGYIIKAKRVSYNKLMKKFVFLSDGFSVYLNVLTSPKIKIFSEKLIINRNNAIFLANKFNVKFLESSNFESFAGTGVALISSRKISMLGSIYTKLTGSVPISYFSTRQYINLSTNRITGFARDNTFFYNNTKFFADSLNIKGGYISICNRYGITIIYLYNTKIHTKCMRYYLNEERLVLPKSEIQSK